jgi:hypothetical protein
MTAHFVFFPPKQDRQYPCTTRCPSLRGDEMSPGRRLAVRWRIRRAFLGVSRVRVTCRTIAVQASPSGSHDPGQGRRAAKPPERPGRPPMLRSAYNSLCLEARIRPAGRLARRKGSRPAGQIKRLFRSPCGGGDNQHEMVVVADMDLSRATGSHAERGMSYERFLAPWWKPVAEAVKRRATRATRARPSPNRLQQSPAPHFTSTGRPVRGAT